MQLRIVNIGVSVVLAGLSALFVGGCGDDDEPPVDLAGNYSINITSRENGCQFDGWQENQPASGIPLVITQEGRSIEGTVEGAVGVYFNILLGTNTFTGSVAENTVTMTLIGRAQVEGDCAYTVNATLTGTLQGDVLTGTIEYTKATNNNPDCAGIQGCVSRQEFNGARPPS